MKPRLLDRTLRDRIVVNHHALQHDLRLRLDDEHRLLLVHEQGRWVVRQHLQEVAVADPAQADRFAGLGRAVDLMLGRGGGGERVVAGRQADRRPAGAAVDDGRLAGGGRGDGVLLLCRERDQRRVDVGAVLGKRGEVRAQPALHLAGGVALDHPPVRQSRLGPLAAAHQGVARLAEGGVREIVRRESRHPVVIGHAPPLRSPFRKMTVR